MTGEDDDRARIPPLRALSLLLRGAIPLIAAALALLAGPTLLVWWLMGGVFGWRHVLIGGAISVGLLVALGLAFGWAIGRAGRSGPHR